MKRICVDFWLLNVNNSDISFINNKTNKKCLFRFSFLDFKGLLKTIKKKLTGKNLAKTKNWHVYPRKIFLSLK